MKPKISYRQARFEDAEAIAKVHMKAWKESYVGLIEQEYLDAISFNDRLTLRKKILTTNIHGFFNLVVLHNEEIIGFCDAGPCSSKSIGYKGEIYAIYLLNEYKHSGIGSELIQKTKEHLLEQQMTPFIVWTLADNKKACQFYKKHGGIIFDKKVEKIGRIEYQEIGYLFDLSPTISLVTGADVPSLVALSYQKRRLYEKAQPKFWKYAGDHAEQAQTKWFEESLTLDDHIMLTATQGDTIVGFIIGKLVAAPEVYNPGGLTLMIDDFCVKHPSDWLVVGAKLIDEIKIRAKEKGAAQIVVVSGAQDEPKRQFLRSCKLSPASEWYVGGIE